MNRNESGYTIVEIIVTLVVGIIIVGAINLLLVNQNHLSQQNRDLVLANAYMEGKVESVRSAGFKSLSDGSTNITSELPAELSAPHSGTVTVSSVDTATKKVNISVTYNDQGKSRTY